MLCLFGLVRAYLLAMDWCFMAGSIWIWVSMYSMFYLLVCGVYGSKYLWLYVVQSWALDVG